MGKSKTGKKGTGEVQKELPGMPEPTPAGKLAIQYLETKDEIEALTEGLGKTGIELIEAMKKENRARITIKGRTLSPKYIEAQVKIAIKKEI